MLCPDSEQLPHCSAVHELVWKGLSLGAMVVLSCVAVSPDTLCPLARAEADAGMFYSPVCPLKVSAEQDGAFASCADGALRWARLCPRQLQPSAKRGIHSLL